MSSPSPKIARDADEVRRMAHRIERHDHAILAAEVRRLADALRVSGPLHTTMLARRCHANHWSEGTVDAAVREGIRRRQLRRLPMGYVDIPRGDS